MYYPNAQELAQATTVELSAGAELRGIDFHVSKVPLYRIRGRIGDQGEPGYGLQLMRVGPGAISFGGAGANTVVRRDGSFEISSVTPGSYLLSATRSVNGSVATAIQPVEVSGRNLDNVVLTWREGQDVEGLMRVERGDASMQLTTTRVVLEPVDLFSINSATALPKDGAAFLIKSVAPVRYRVNVVGNPKGTYLKTIRLNGQEIVDGILNFTGGAGGQLEIVLSAKGAQVSGTVQNEDGKPVPGALVVVVPDAERRARFDLFRTTIADQNGNFALEGIAPGGYSVYSWQELEETAYMDPEVLSASESKAAKVKLGEAANETVQLKIASR
jgi:hypothetical protein